MTVLIALDRLLVNQVGDIDLHTSRVILTATDFLLERMEELIYLYGKCSRFGLAFTMTRRFLAQTLQVFATDRGGQLDIGHRLAQRAVLYDQLHMHLGLAFQF